MEVYAVYYGYNEDYKIRELYATKELALQACRNFEIEGKDNCNVRSIEVKDKLENMPDNIYLYGDIFLDKDGKIKSVSIYVWESDWEKEEFSKTIGKVVYEEIKDTSSRRHNYEKFGYFRYKVDFYLVLGIEGKNLEELKNKGKELAKEQFDAYNEKFLEEENILI